MEKIRVSYLARLKLIIKTIIVIIIILIIIIIIIN